MNLPTQPSENSGIARNIVAGLSVSFVALSLGAAFGLLSGRGAFAGMISAALIPIITSALGGTRVQTSGPTAPMTTVMAVVVAFARDEFAAMHPESGPDMFVSLVIIASSLLLLLGAALRLGRFIELVPKVVVSGFMNGIAVLIWLDQVKKLFGVMGKDAFSGPMWLNTVLALTTLALIFMAPTIVSKLPEKIRGALSGTLVGILGMTAVSYFLAPEVERVNLPSLAELGDVSSMFAAFIPTEMPSGEIALLALRFGGELAALNYLDTLLTALVVDRITGEKTAQNKELAAQGVSCLAVVPFGGIPGAQATIRSVLIIKDGATERWAGILVGVFALVEMLIFRDAIVLIPQCVLAGVLLKVGIDVFDWHPVVEYWQWLRGKWSSADHPVTEDVEHIEMLFIIGTTLVTVMVNLNVAVIAFTLMFYMYNKVWAARRKVHKVHIDDDYVEATEDMHDL